MTYLLYPSPLENLKLLYKKPHGLKGKPKSKEHIENISKSKIGCQSNSGSFHKGQPSWCKGLTKETDIRVNQISEKMKNREVSLETKEKQRQAKLGIPLSETHKQHLRENHWDNSGGNHYNHNKHLSEEIKNKISESQIGKIISIETKLKQSNSRKEYLKNHPEVIKRMKERKGKLSSSYGRVPSHDKRYTHISPLQGELKFHTWDYKYALYLESIGEPYLYEMFTFELNVNEKDVTYTPDFYLFNSDTFVEIKGYWRDDAKSKYNKFKENYSNIKIKILYGKDLQELGINIK